MYNIRFTEQADTDLYGIYIYTFQTWGDRQADKYSELLREAIHRLAEDPFRPETKDRSDVGQAYRSHHCGRHLIFYHIRDEQIEILRILHDSMDVHRHFADDDTE